MTVSAFTLRVIPGPLLYTILQHYTLSFISFTPAAYIHLLLLLLVFAK